MANSWKSFDFFEARQATLGDDETRLFFESNEIASVCSGSDSLFLGSYDGYVRIVSPSWKIVRSFLAHDVGSITHMRQVEGTSLLVTVAEDLSTEPVLKVWALDRPAKKTGLPTCLSTLRISNGLKPFPISAFTATDDLTQLAAGFANGAVTLVRGDLVNDTGTRQRTVYESDEPVTGVELDVDDQFTTTLFVATTARIVKLPILAKGKTQPPKTVEDAGCGVGCMTRDRRTGAIVVARDDAIYYYSTLDGRGPPRAYDGPKTLVSVYDGYVALVSPASPRRAGAGGGANSSNGLRDSRGALRRLIGPTAATTSSSADALFSASTFALLETDLRVVAHAEPLLSPVKAVFALWGSLCTLTLDGKVRQYREKPLAQRLALLYSRNLYHLAIELAAQAGLDAAQQNVIFRKFGDYLYSKGRYDEAMAQYIRALDSTEPSQVIRKFLDTQRIHNLIEYLEELHERHRATADHTTLLLNCYAKLKDRAKLEAFIHRSSDAGGGDLKFDLDTAIAMCRQGGYYDQAVYLAKQYGENDLVVDILLEDAQQYDAALQFIWRQEPQTAYTCLMKYARVLIEHCPQDATQLFIDYYTGRYKPKPDDDAAAAEASAAAAAAAATETAAAGGGFAFQNLAGLIALPRMGGPAEDPKVTAAAAAAAAAAASTPASPKAGGSSTASGAASTAMTTAAATIDYTPPRLRTAFSSFIDHTDEFIVFLEACLEGEKAGGRLSEADRTDLHTTLFEVYLLKAAEKKTDDEQREAWEAKAKALIREGPPSATTATAPSTGAPIEQANVLLLSHLSHFRTGTTLVKEQAGLVFDIFRSYTSAQDTAGALRALAKYGPAEPQLYPAALAYLTSSARVLEAAGADALAGVLQRIERDGLMAPLQVVQTLSANPVATMGMIKPYLQETIERERRAIAADERRIRSFRQETAARRAELATLAGTPTVFQATRCSQCALPLELPVVHFLCKHSFHQRCLANPSDASSDGGGGGTTTADWCPQCAQDNATVRAIRRQQEEYATRHDLFRAELAGSDDRFGTVADWFQRGVMGATGE